MSEGLPRVDVLAHELRSPVAALVALAEVLAERRETISDGDLRRLLELAVAAGRNVERLLADPDLLSVRLETVDVTRLVEGVAPPAATVDVAPGLSVTGDPVRLRQVLANLVANAVRHGGAVTLRAAAAGSEVRITVSDDGPGVERGLDVFAPGVSGAGSTGYGLAIVRAIALAHGGRVELESVPGEGAAFTLVLPSASGRAS